MSNTKKIRFIDLFCGIGSFHYSFHKFNWECIMACDISSDARQTYFKNYGIEPLGDILDINPIEISPYDILCAGFPCQPFSQCGKQKGFEDERGTMFEQLMKFVSFHAPSIILLENVQGLLSHNDGSSFRKIKNTIEGKGYSVSYSVLKCSDYGIPQMRKRLFIIAIRKDAEYISQLDKILNLDEHKKQTTLSDWFGRSFSKDTAYTIRCGGRRSPIGDRHNWDGYIVDNQEYRLTIEDCLSLQGFENDFHLYGSEQQRWKQIGNTIPTIFTKLIAANIQKYCFNLE